MGPVTQSFVINCTIYCNGHYVQSIAKINHCLDFIIYLYIYVVGQITFCLYYREKPVIDYLKEHSSLSFQC